MRGSSLPRGGCASHSCRLSRALACRSHRLVTIPPVGWVNVAHTHGVPVLGTLITEWEAGAVACRQLFGTAAAAEAVAAQLAAIAAHHGFDGWLINIENGVDTEHIPHLLHFLRCAHSNGLAWVSLPCV